MDPDIQLFSVPSRYVCSEVFIQNPMPTLPLEIVLSLTGYRDFTIRSPLRNINDILDRDALSQKSAFIDERSASRCLQMPRCENLA